MYKLPSLRYFVLAAQWTKISIICSNLVFYKPVILGPERLRDLPKATKQMRTQNIGFPVPPRASYLKSISQYRKSLTYPDRVAISVPVLQRRKQRPETGSDLPKITQRKLQAEPAAARTEGSGALSIVRHCRLGAAQSKGPGEGGLWAGGRATVEEEGCQEQTQRRLSSTSSLARGGHRSASRCCPHT